MEEKEKSSHWNKKNTIHQWLFHTSRVCQKHWQECTKDTESPRL